MASVRPTLSLLSPAAPAPGFTHSTHPPPSRALAQAGRALADSATEHSPSALVIISEMEDINVVTEQWPWGETAASRQLTLARTNVQNIILS